MEIATEVEGDRGPTLMFLPLDRGEEVEAIVGLGEGYQDEIGGISQDQPHCPDLYHAQDDDPSRRPSRDLEAEVVRGLFRPRAPVPAHHREEATNADGTTPGPQHVLFRAREQDLTLLPLPEADADHLQVLIRALAPVLVLFRPAPHQPAATVVKPVSVLGVGEEAVPQAAPEAGECLHHQIEDDVEPRRSVNAVLPGLGRGRAHTHEAHFHLLAVAETVNHAVAVRGTTIATTTGTPGHRHKKSLGDAADPSSDMNHQ